MNSTDVSALAATIDAAYEQRDSIGQNAAANIHDAVKTSLALLDRGEVRVAEKKGDAWVVNQWLKKAVLLYFRLTPSATIAGGPGSAVWWDKVPSKFEGWTAADFEKGGFRAV